ncbi:MAG: hypothetical protein ABIR24_04350 [Verrucomicrobiota bacterium]
MIRFFYTLLCALIVTFGLTSPSANAGILYASTAAGAAGELYIINSANGAMVQDVGPLNDSSSVNYPMTGLAFHPSSGVLYGSTGNSVVSTAAKLVTINPNTCLVTVIGSFNAGPVNGSGTPATMADLAFDNAGNLYGVGSIGGPQLYTINISTGQATLVGPTGLTSTTGGGLAVNSAGFFYGSPTATRFGTYNSTSGAFSNIAAPAPTPALSGYATFAFDENDVLFSINLAPAGVTHLVTFNLATGVNTDLGASVTSLDAIAFQTFPKLAIALAVSNQVTVRWPDFAGYNLEYKTNLTSGVWQTNAVTPTLNNGTNSVTLPIDSAAKFFRLRKP